MPADSEHPVTVEALYVVQSFNDIRSATVADLVSALRAEGMREVLAAAIFNAEFAEVDWAAAKAEYEEDEADFEDEMRFYYHAADAVLDALAEAQP